MPSSTIHFRIRHSFLCTSAIHSQPIQASLSKSYLLPRLSGDFIHILNQSFFHSGSRFFVTMVIHMILPHICLTHLINSIQTLRETLVSYLKKKYNYHVFIHRLLNILFHLWNIITFPHLIVLNLTGVYFQ